MARLCDIYTVYKKHAIIHISNYSYLLKFCKADNVAIYICQGSVFRVPTNGLSSQYTDK